MNLICIMCPTGCSLDVTKHKDGKITVSGNLCPRGTQYGIDEVTNPKRIVTSLINTKNGVLPVKTTIAIPKKLVNASLEEIAKINLPSANFGEVVIKNILNTGADVIVTGSYKK